MAIFTYDLLSRKGLAPFAGRSVQRLHNAVTFVLIQQPVGWLSADRLRDTINGKNKNVPWRPSVMADLCRPLSRRTDVRCCCLTLPDAIRSSSVDTVHSGSLWSILNPLLSRTYSISKDSSRRTTRYALNNWTRETEESRTVPSFVESFDYSLATLDVGYQRSKSPTSDERWIRW